MIVLKHRIDTVYLRILLASAKFCGKTKITGGSRPACVVGWERSHQLKEVCRACRVIAYVMFVGPARL